MALGGQSAELGPREGAAAKAVMEAALGRQLRPSQAVLAKDTSMVLNLSAAHLGHADNILLDTPKSGAHADRVARILMVG